MLADARSAVQEATGTFGGLDVLVNCVGIFDFYRGLADIEDDQLDGAFDEIFAVNRVLGATADREQDLRRRTPLRVALTGEDHAGSYVFLASDRARGITGTVVHSDGGAGIK